MSQQLILLDFFIKDLDDGAQGTLALPSSLVTPNWEKWMTQQGIVLLSTGTSTSWRSGLVGTSEAQQGEGQSPAPEEEQPHAQGHAGAACRETSRAKKALGILVSTGLNMNQENVLVGKKVNGIQGCTEECFQKAKEGDSSPLLRAGGATPEVLGPVLGSSVGERHGRDWRESSQGNEDDGQEHFSCEQRLREEAQGLMVV